MNDTLDKYYVLIDTICVNIVHGNNDYNLFEINYYQILDKYYILGFGFGFGFGFGVVVGVV